MEKIKNYTRNGLRRFKTKLETSVKFTFHVGEPSLEVRGLITFWKIWSIFFKIKSNTSCFEFKIRLDITLKIWDVHKKGIQSHIMTRVNVTSTLCTITYNQGNLGDCFFPPPARVQIKGYKGLLSWGRWPGGCGAERKNLSFFFSNLSWVEERKLLRIYR